VNGESILQILRDASGANGKENKRARPGAPPPARGSSAPPRSISPSDTGHRRGVTRPASAGLQGSEPPLKRARLGDSTDKGPNLASSAASLGKATSRIAMPVPVRAGPGSALPRAVSVPRIVAQHAALGHGRVPSTQHTRHPNGPRSVSTSHISNPRGAPSTTRRVVSTAQKASRARRESFRPRPSVEVIKSVSLSGRYAGLADGAVEELIEEENDESGDG